MPPAAPPPLPVLSLETAPIPSSPDKQVPLPYGPSAGFAAFRMKPHRGGLLLWLGITGLFMSLASWLLFCCPIFGVAFSLLAIGISGTAAVMGGKDWKQIQAGEMDPSGRGLTVGGFFCGLGGSSLAAGSLLLAAVITVLGLTQSSTNKNPSIPAMARTDSQPESDLAKPNFTIAAEDLAKAYAADEKAAKAKYDDKVVRVTGVVKRVSTENVFGTTTVELNGEDNLGVACGVPEEGVAKAKGLKKRPTGDFARRV